MPVVKIPIRHRFGVISHSQKVQLQETILQELTIQDAQKQNDKYHDPVEKCEALVHHIRELQIKQAELEAKLKKLPTSKLTSRASTEFQAKKKKIEAKFTFIHAGDSVLLRFLRYPGLQHVKLLMKRRK